MATNVTVKGQVTLPKAIREAADIRHGDRVNVSFLLAQFDPILYVHRTPSMIEDC